MIAGRVRAGDGVTWVVGGGTSGSSWVMGTADGNGLGRKLTA